MNDLEKVVAEARKLGMSYGKYVEMLKREEQMTQELKEQIIADYESGLSAEEIANKYKINPTTTKNNIWNWKEKGLIKSAPVAEQKKPVENHEPISAPADNVDMSAIANLEKLQGFIKELGNVEINGIYADNSLSTSEVTFTLGGKSYVMQMKEVCNGQ